MSTTIAIIEDDLKLAKLMQAYLVKQGCNVLIEHRGDRAIYRIIKAQPQLVILDIMLPKIDGLTVCREIRQYYDGPVIMLTASAGDETEINGLTNGADAYLKKPIDPPVLLAHIQALLRRSNQAVKPIKLEFDYDEFNRSIDMTICNLRKKFHDEPGARIKTVWGKGYLFVAENW